MGRVSERINQGLPKEDPITDVEVAAERLLNIEHQSGLWNVQPKLVGVVLRVLGV